MLRNSKPFRLDDHEGSSEAKALFVGEQPGNNEDLQGRPFVGPAGKLLDGDGEKFVRDLKKVAKIIHEHAR